MLEFNDSSSSLLGDYRATCSYKPSRIFDPLLVEFLSVLSSEIMKSSEAKEFPDLMSFAFWCRNSNIKQFERNYPKSEIRFGLGKVLHITPKNVPINFAFSWALSALAGNSNFIKLPTDFFPQIEIFLDLFKKTVKTNKYKRILESVVFFKTEHGSNLIKELSLACEARVIWGSNQTIEAIKKFAVQPRFMDLTFPSRISIAAISASAFLELDFSKREVVVRKFLQDALSFGQRGCSSPRKIFWMGTKEDYVEARGHFWGLANRLSSKLIQMPDSFTRFSNLSILSTNNQRNFTFSSSIHDPLIVLESLEDPNSDFETILSFGTFLEKRIDSIEETLEVDARNLQTVTYFGLDPESLVTSIKESGFLGIDRIVPFGAAFDMTPSWDGIDTLRSLSRIIEIR
jgi:hypothetical protein